MSSSRAASLHRQALRARDTLFQAPLLAKRGIEGPLKYVFAQIPACLTQYSLSSSFRHQMHTYTSQRVLLVLHPPPQVPGNLSRQ
jgi:hypothetical protein